MRKAPPPARTPSVRPTPRACEGVSPCHAAHLSVASVLAAPLLALACAGSPAQADIIYGLNSNGTQGIYEIDTNTGATTLVAATPSLAAADSAGNALAYDAANNAFYYVGRTGTTNYFMRNVAASGTTSARSATQPIFSGTFYNGHYWAVRNGAANTVLRLTPTATGFTPALLAIGLPINSNFGDIASTDAGLTYASCTSGFFSFDLNTAGSPAAAISLAPSTDQIAFGNSGLFAIQGADIYSVDVATGAKTFLASTSPDLSFNDLASISSPGAIALLGFAGLGAHRRRR